MQFVQFGKRRRYTTTIRRRGYSCFLLRRGNTNGPQD